MPVPSTAAVADLGARIIRVQPTGTFPLTMEANFFLLILERSPSTTLAQLCEIPSLGPYRYCKCVYALHCIARNGRRTFQERQTQRGGRRRRATQRTPAAHAQNCRSRRAPGGRCRRWSETAVAGSAFVSADASEMAVAEITAEHTKTARRQQRHCARAMQKRARTPATHAIVLFGGIGDL